MKVIYYIFQKVGGILLLLKKKVIFLKLIIILYLNIFVSINSIFLILLLAITSFLRGIGDIQAYHYGEAAVLAPFTYLRLIFVGTFGYFIWEEIPNNLTLLGAIIIICAAIYIGQREARVKSKSLR